MFTLLSYLDTHMEFYTINLLLLACSKQNILIGVDGSFILG